MMCVVIWRFAPEAVACMNCRMPPASAGSNEERASKVSGKVGAITVGKLSTTHRSGNDREHAPLDSREPAGTEIHS